MIVNVKLNNLIWLLTGRSSGFAYPLLNTNISVPYAQDTRVRAARRMLKLDVRGIDFFVYGALASVYSSLYYVRDLDVEHQAAFVPGVIPLTSRSADVYHRDDGDIVYQGNAPYVVTESNAWDMLPFFDARTVSVVKNPINWFNPHDSLRLSYSAENNQLTATKYWLNVAGERVTVYAKPVLSNIAVDMMEFAGLKAQFSMVGTSTRISTPPALYPYELLRDLIRDDSELIELMLDMGTAEAFHEATSPITAVGALATSIIRRSKADAPSYEVTVSDELQPGIPKEMQLVVNFDATKLEVPCNE